MLTEVTAAWKNNWRLHQAEISLSPFAVQRNGPLPSHSVAGQPHLVRNLALLQAVLGQPGVGGGNGPIDMIGGSREIVG
jgi:hypothetical protein